MKPTRSITPTTPGRMSRWIATGPALAMLLQLTPANASNQAALLDAIAQVESGGDNNARGRHGERTAWQLRSAALADVASFRRAINGSGNISGHIIDNPADARAAAADYLMIIGLRFRRINGCNPSVREVLAAWNWGFSKCARVHFDIRRMPKTVRGYIERVQACYTSARARTCAAGSLPTGVNVQ